MSGNKFAHHRIPPQECNSFTMNVYKKFCSWAGISEREEEGEAHKSRQSGRDRTKKGMYKWPTSMQQQQRYTAASKHPEPVGL